MLAPLPYDRLLRRMWWIAPTLCLTGLMPWSAIATEQSDLTALLRQIDQLEYQVQSMAHDHPNGGSRYQFDHGRLRSDLQRIRQGIRDYLSPQRAQPRDPTPLSGEYRQETEAAL